MSAISLGKFVRSTKSFGTYASHSGRWQPNLPRHGSFRASRSLYTHFSRRIASYKCSTFPRVRPNIYTSQSRSQLLPAVRHQSTTGTSPAAATIPDPEREDLYYHLFEPPHELSHNNAVFALSFLRVPPLNVVSPAVIGWLPALSDEMQAGLNDFTENGTSII